MKRPEQWKWSSFPEYAGVDAAEQEKGCGLTIDRVRLPADEKARIEAESRGPTRQVRATLASHYW